MARIDEIVRVLMILLCLVPFTSARQAGGALALYVPTSLPVSPDRGAPAPTSEEEDERAGAKERLLAQARHRQPLGYRIDTLPLAHDSRLAPTPHSQPTSPFDADPFRNGLGSPYHC